MKEVRPDYGNEKLADLVIGLTGPMCTGKNVAATILEKQGFAVVDADVIAHQALEDVKDEVLAAFSDIAEKKGIDLCLSDGTLNRKGLASIVFSDPGLLALHESIIYPRINYLLDSFIDTHRNQGAVINAPILHKSSVLSRCNFVIYIDSWLPLRLLRAKKRDHLPLRQILARFSAQKNLFTQYISKNVDIERVYNRGSRRALEKRLVRLLSNRGY